MINSFKLTILGDPISKANGVGVRWSRALKRCEMFTHEKFELYEQEVRVESLRQMLTANYQCIDTGPVSIQIDYYLAERRVKDLLNLPKTTCDALNGVAYRDDAQIVTAVCNKYYDSTNPRVEIWVGRPRNWEARLATWSLILKDAGDAPEKKPRKPAKKKQDKDKTTDDKSKLLPSTGTTASKSRKPRAKKAAKSPGDQPAKQSTRRNGTRRPV